MSLCAACGQESYGDANLCVNHVTTLPAEWATANRIWCNYFHRGTAIVRLSAIDREDDFWGDAPPESYL